MSYLIRRSRRLLSITICSFIRGLLIPSFMVITPLYLVSIGYKVPDFGPIATYATIVSSLLLPILGYLTDLGFIAVLGVTSNLYATLSLLIPALSSGNYLLVVLSYTLANLSMFTWQAVRGAIVVREVSTDVYGRVFASFSFAFNISRVVAPSIAIGLAKYLGYEKALVTLSSLGIVASIIFYLAIKEHRIMYRRLDMRPKLLNSVKDSYLNMVRILKLRSGLLRLVIFSILDRFGWALWMPMLNAYLKVTCGLGDIGVGIFNTLLALSMLITSYPSGYLTDKLGAIRSLLTNEFLALISTIILAVARNSIMIYVASVTMGLSISLWIASFNAVITSMGGIENVGIVRTGIDSIRTLIAVPAPFIGSTLYYVAVPAPFLTGALLMVLAIAVLIRSPTYT